MDAALRSQIEALRTLKTKALQDRYRALFREPTASSNRDHLFRRIAWRLQANIAGGLSQRARRRARQLADHRDVRLRAPRHFWKDLDGPQTHQDPGRDSRLPLVGTVLKRSYRGEEVLVTIHEDGFEWRGRNYTSLSAVAYQVTGTRWNGFAF